MTSVLALGRDISDPTLPPTCAAGTSAGSMAPGLYMYKYSFKTNFGETLASPASVAVLSAGSVDISSIATDPLREISARRIYRTAVGGSTFFFLAQLNDNLTTTYFDDADDSELGAPEPIANFASTVERFEGWFKFNRQVAHSVAPVIAAGTVHADATNINDSEYVFAVVPVNLNGVKLPAINPNLIGLRVTINNADAFNTLLVYPFELTTNINGGVPGAPISVAPGFSLNLICVNSIGWFYSSSLTAGVAGPPSGFAGGDLDPTSTYPAPALVTTGVIANTYGSTTQIPVVTFDAKGRATFATSVLANTTPGGLVPGGGDLAGSYPAPVLTTSGVVAGTYGTPTFVPTITVDTKGRVTSATQSLITAVASGPAGGALTGTYPNPQLNATGVTAGTYGSTSQVPVLGIDAEGRVTTAATVGLTAVPGGVASGDLTGTYPGPTLALSGVAAGVYGASAQVPVLSIDAKGRITSATTAAVGGGPPSGVAGGSLSGTYPSPSLSATGVPAATYTKLTVNLEGRVTAGANLAASDVPNSLGDVTGPHTATVVSRVQNIITTGNAGMGVLMINGNAVNIGSNVVAFGPGALGANLSGSNNTAVGYNAGAAITGASGSTAVGSSALTLAVGANNTAVGHNAGSAIVGGSGNTILGTGAGTTLTSGSNCTIIGNGASSSTASVDNEITLGNGSITTIRAQVTTITSLSDARDKKNIAKLNAGLEFVSMLKPVSFDWNSRDGSKVNIPDTGFIAQDLQSVQEESGVNIPGLVYDVNPEKLEAGYGKLLPVLVRAIQELKEIVDAQAELIANLRKL